MKAYFLIDTEPTKVFKFAEQLRVDNSFESVDVLFGEFSHLVKTVNMPLNSISVLYNEIKNKEFVVNTKMLSIKE